MTTLTSLQKRSTSPGLGAKQAVLLVGLLLMLAAALASLMFGARSVPPEAVWQALSGHGETTDQAAVLTRIPRTLAALLVGAALAVSGLGMQAVTRNPLAEPGIFGVLAGASLFVVVGIAFFDLSGTLTTMLVAICGSTTAALFVYAVGSIGGATPLKLALAGAATAAALSSMVSAVLLPRVEVMDVFRFWQIGSVGGTSWEQLRWAAPAVAVGMVLAAATVMGMNLLALGDDLAAGLGASVSAQRALIAASAVILAGAATSVAGPVAFVGLIVPHVLRLLMGIDHRWLLPACALYGAALLATADVVGRLVARPEEVAVGVLLPLIGAPVFIWIVRRQRVREL
ncbi:FecCD family ABC transporter permease [Corynebacterium kozikiae]|uniref:FecCD family ABC transporter permease n=1 Tax=Corynebacterium kozikiae TaxID=2968469 RepID=UPI00359C6633